MLEGHLVSLLNNSLMGAVLLKRMSRSSIKHSLPSALFTRRSSVAKDLPHENTDKNVCMGVLYIKGSQRRQRKDSIPSAWRGWAGKQERQDSLEGKGDDVSYGKISNLHDTYK